MSRKSRELTQPASQLEQCYSTVRRLTFDDNIVPQEGNDNRSTAKDDRSGDDHIAEELDMSLTSLPTLLPPSSLCVKGARESTQIEGSRHFSPRIL